MTPRPVLPALGLLAALAGSASAQTASGPGFSFVLRGVEFTACVDFLMDPVAASKQLSAGYSIVPAASFAGTSPLLLQELQGDSTHAGWVAARLCVVEAPTISAGGSVLSADKKMGGREVVGYWAIAARRTAETFRQDQWFAVTLWTNDWHVERQAKSAFVPMATFKRMLDPVKESTNYRYELKIRKTVLWWEGELVGRDSTATSDAAESSLLLDGLRDIQWTGTVSARPQWTRTLPGVFQITGKDDLAKALKASPIRMFGPMYWGGDARLDFVR